MTLRANGLLDALVDRCGTARTLARAAAGAGRPAPARATRLYAFAVRPAASAASAKRFMFPPAEIVSR